MSLENVNVHGGTAGAGGPFTAAARVFCGIAEGQLDGQYCSARKSWGGRRQLRQLHWKHGYADGELLIAGANPQVNLTDVSLSSIHVVAGEDANVRLVRVQSDLKLEKVEDRAEISAERDGDGAPDFLCNF